MSLGNCCAAMCTFVSQGIIDVAIISPSFLPWWGLLYRPSSTFNMNGILNATTISQETQIAIAKGFWGLPVGDDHYHPRNLAPYIHYFIEQTAAFYNIFGNKAPLKSYEDLNDLTNDILQDLPRSVIQRNLFQKHSSPFTPSTTDEDVIPCTVDLVLRLITMMDVGFLPRTHTGRRPIEWNDPSWSATQFIEHSLKPERSMSHGNIKLGSQFTARNLNLIAGLKVELTTNIVDHLTLHEKDNLVLIFCHASFLKNQNK